MEVDRDRRRTAADAFTEEDPEIAAASRGRASSRARADIDGTSVVRQDPSPPPRSTPTRATGFSIDTDARGRPPSNVQSAETPLGPIYFASLPQPGGSTSTIVTWTALDNRRDLEKSARAKNPAASVLLPQLAARSILASFAPSVVLSNGLLAKIDRNFFLIFTSPTRLNKASEKEVWWAAGVFVDAAATKRN